MAEAEARRFAGTRQAHAKQSRVDRQLSLRFSDANRCVNPTRFPGSRLEPTSLLRPAARNPVRAAMVERPEDYRWSSVHTHLGLAQDPLLTAHSVCTGLGPDRTSRADAYRDWLLGPLDPEELARIRACLAQERRSATPASRR